MTGSAIATLRMLPSARYLPAKLLIIAALVIFADWLFFGRAIGISVVLFVLALAVAIPLGNAVRATRREFLIATGVLLAALLPAIEAQGAMSTVFAAAGLAYFALALTTMMSGGLRQRCMASLTLFLAAPYQIFSDLIRAYDEQEPADRASSGNQGLAVWTVPLFFALIFLVLFVIANPVLEFWFLAIDPRGWLARVDFARMLFWLFAIVIIWPFIWMRARRSLDINFKPTPLDARDLATCQRLFGDAAILRSLVVFNLLFAIQTCLDIAYLWRGVALPDGMTYATYAHRGAYPLILTALLAAAFVIAALRPGSTAERTPVIRALVFIWVAQTVVLVISSMLRLDLYVEVYSLTGLRTAAFIWMLLVAIGLVLIVARILLHRSNEWLVAANVGALILTIYVCTFINFSYVIANYNVDHSRELTGQGQAMDLAYLADLGPQAVPAMDRYLASVPQGNTTRTLLAWRNRLAAATLERMDNWRAWTFRDWRLERYLVERADAKDSPP